MSEFMCNKSLKLEAVPWEVQNISNPAQIECNERSIYHQSCMYYYINFKNKVSLSPSSSPPSLPLVTDSLFYKGFQEQL